MFDLQNLEPQEKIFLAGCIKSMILSDGRFDDDELSDVDRIVEEYKFSDYDYALQEFENELDHQSEFWDMARQINRPEARDTILTLLNEVSLKSGYQDSQQSNLMNELEALWKDTYRAD